MSVETSVAVIAIVNTNLNRRKYVTLDIFSILSFNSSYEMDFVGDPIAKKFESSFSAFVPHRILKLTIFDKFFDILDWFNHFWDFPHVHQEIHKAWYFG